MKTIIHPTDFSENAAKALEFAIDLSARFNAELIITSIGNVPTILNSSSSLSSFSKMEEERKVDIIEQLEGYAAKHTDKAESNFKIQFIEMSTRYHSARSQS